MATIKQIKTSSGTNAYDIAAKFDINENEITSTYATKTEAVITTDTLIINCGTSTTVI